MTTLKTVSMFLRASKVEAEEAGESTEGMANSVSELRDQLMLLTNGRVDILTDEGNYKGTYEILRDIASVWDDIVANQGTDSAAILELIGGKRNANIVAAILENFEIAEDALKVAMESAGSAVVENEKHLDSIAGKIEKFKAQFESLSTTLINSDFVKGVVDLGSFFIDALNYVAKLVDAIGGLNTIISVTIGLIAASKASVIAEFLLGVISKVSRLGNDIARLGPIFKGLRSSGTKTFDAISQSLDVVGVSASTAQIALSAIVLVVGAVVTAYKKVKQAQEEARQKSIDNAKASSELSGEITNLTAQYISLSEAIKTDSSAKESLIKTQDELIEKLGLEQYELDKLIEKYDGLSNAVLKASVDKLKASEIDISEGVKAREYDLINSTSMSDTAFVDLRGIGYYSGGNLLPTENDYVKMEKAHADAQAAFDALQKAGLLASGSNQNANGDFRLNFDFDLDSVEGVVDAHEKLRQMLIVVDDTAGSNNQVYETLHGLYKNIDEAVLNYTDSVADLNKNLAQQYVVQGLIGKEVPDTKEGFDAYRKSVVDAAVASGEFIGSTEEIENAVDNVLKQDESFKHFYLSATDGAHSVALSVADLSDLMQQLKSSYDIVSSAQKEMAASGGISVDTINAMSNITKDYIDYLYEENGLIKLNVQAWKERSNVEIGENFNNIQSNIDALIAENEALYAKKKSYEDQRSLSDGGGIWLDLIVKTNQAIAENNDKIAENQELLSVYNSAYSSITSELDAYESALYGFSNVADTMSSISSSLTTVADIQKEVADGFTMSLEKAMEFAKVYPEIMNSATMAADGQITLNEDVVNAFISGKEMELKAQVDAEVAKLEADKAVLTAKMEFAEAQLELAKSVGTGEGQISKEVAEYRVNAGNAVAQALISAGIDEATAYQLACASMAQNAEEFNRVAAEVCTDIQGNFNQAAFDAAQSIYTNMQNSKASIASLARQAHEAAKAIAGIASGTQQGSDVIVGGGAGGSNVSGGSINVSTGNFDGHTFVYEAKEIALEDFMSSLEIDISNYSKAIEQIDGQIAALQSLRGTSLDDFSSSRGGGKSKSNDKSWFEKEYALHQHLLKMDAENVEDYLNWLNTAYQRAYEEGVIGLDEFYKYQEEVYSGLQDVFKDYLNDVEHEISMRQNYDGENKKIIKLYEKLIKDVEKEISSARDRGLTDEDDYIQSLQKKWQDYTKSISDIREDTTNNAKTALNKLVDYRIDMLKKEVDGEKDALDKKLDNLKEFYDKQKEMLRDSRDEEKYLYEQSDKRTAVNNLREELAMLKHDDSAWAQKRILEIQEELAIAQKDLDEFEKDHALDVAIDALDKTYAEQESQIQAEMDALEERLNDPEALYNRALEDIRKNSENQLYYQMLMYNRQFGDGNDETVKELWESVYGALDDYEKLFGDPYNGVKLENETGVDGGDGWDDSKISGTNPDNKKPDESPNQKKPDTKPKEEKKPSLKKGDSIQVKKTATHFSSKSGGSRMASFVPGGTYTVYKTSGSEVLIGRDGVYTGWINKSDIVGYRLGTNYSIGGLAQWDEDGRGSEYIFESSDGNRYRMFAEGSKVLNSDATNFLYEFATSGGEILSKMLTDIFGLSNFSNIVKPVQAIDIHTGNIIVQGNATERTVSEIRRAQRDNLEFVIKEFNKLNK